MMVNKKIALTILEDETNNRHTVSDNWIDLIERLSVECEEKANKTFIAMLGTALLARATDIRIDPFSLKAGLDSPGAYSARSLCKDVLVAHAPRLGIDLGVTGREPLNNQPFFAEDRVHAGLPVHARATKGFAILLEALQRINSISDETEARSALRAFLHRRKFQRYAGETSLRTGTGLRASDLTESITQYVSENSEFGKRAQACAAGVLEVFAPGAVVVGRIHDPDRKFPGDINIREADQISHAFEVRDKPVTEPDLFHFVRKVADHLIPSACVIAVGHKQELLDISRLEKFVEEREITFCFLNSWEALIRNSAFWSREVFENTTEEMFKWIQRRSVDLEVSEEGIRLWEKLAQKTREDN